VLRFKYTKNWVISPLDQAFSDMVLRNIFSRDGGSEGGLKTAAQASIDAHRL
jgi:hypothetical protein